MTSLFTGLIAYLPRPHAGLMDLTRRSVESTRQFRELGPVVCYHAQDPLPPKPGLCEATHSAFGKDPIVLEYYNGSLGDSWRVLLSSAFDAQGYEWVMFVSNDVIWKPGAVDHIRKLIEGGQDPMTYGVAAPTAVFLMNWRLWRALKPNLFMDYLPCSWEDMDLCCQVWAAGGEQNTPFGDTHVHEGEGTIRNLGKNYRDGTNDENWRKNRDLFVRRWGTEPVFTKPNFWQSWPPTREQIEEMRRHPKRPYPP